MIASRLKITNDVSKRNESVATQTVLQTALNYEIDEKLENHENSNRLFHKIKKELTSVKVFGEMANNLRVIGNVVYYYVSLSESILIEIGD
jgi:hypothetical protein